MTLCQLNRILLSAKFTYCVIVPLLGKGNGLPFVSTRIFLHFENEDHIGASPATDLEGTVNVLF